MRRAEGARAAAQRAEVASLRRLERDIHPQVVRQLMLGGRRSDPVATLTPREREVMALMAQGLSNQAVAASLHVTEGAVEKHTQRIFAKLDLHADPKSHRRVQAVLGWLRTTT